MKHVPLVSTSLLDDLLPLDFTMCIITSHIQQFASRLSTFGAETQLGL